MSDNFIPLSHCLSQITQRRTPIAYHAGHYYTDEQFHAAVIMWTQRFNAQSAQDYALYTDSAYPFAVLLFALFHAGKKVWLASNNCPATAQQLKQHCQLIGDWTSDQPFNYQLDMPMESPLIANDELLLLNPSDTQLIIFTSGSTGNAKPIIKQLAQLQRECSTLENHWGKQLGNTEVLSTVSHQHIYGLLFRVLWPLFAGRCFHSQCYLNPESLIHNAQDKTACWVASPAQLKRLAIDSPWEEISKLTAIFSSGGALPASAAHQILQHSKQAVIEIYGSSETGGIAWRQQSTAWTLFDNMRLTQNATRWQLTSPYLPSPVLLDDQLSLQTDGRFMLHGRLDRIVKIEEKRLSLTELEQCLLATPWLSEAFTLRITTHRDLIAAAIVLTEAGQQRLAMLGRKHFIQQLRATLHQRFETVLLPKKWLFFNSLPLTPQGKIDQTLLIQLFNTDQTKLPQLQSVNSQSNNIELALKVPASLIYFPGHFASYPILAGVVQIAWVAHFGKLFFALDQPFLTMEVIKFAKLIHPNDELILTLYWKPDTGKLQFSFSSPQGIHSSGRLIQHEIHTPNSSHS
jgi:acyl-coenzyme A synthetase/AMP-(fatty) acid ligase/3-hydroxymyristoyl/3-hydroxydecanoyl-(acyl carrier protein) dehydratase